MTLAPYDPEKFDDLALRLLDLAAIFRGMARRSRDEQVDELSLQDKKATEWLTRFEFWTNDTVQKFESAAIKSRGERRAKEIADRPQGGRAANQ